MYVERDLLNPLGYGWVQGIWGIMSTHTYLFMHHVDAQIDCKYIHIISLYRPSKHIDLSLYVSKRIAASDQ